ncbi:hypothetical protein BDV38DRAFT_67850 [Aspergillus pseudotamarii]|uniref:Uncharacterized protein n=1 Tax=Aspergillus pseudotamarii TaxID=132259 RepID=A0A5N6TB08_ASPPS|nr:uncharacterized protein BDV38DRAFT_67850 [Aspergillus pseudotamarii]KAE8143513.1 hypothetical protein BDV38DRAFT_67850 [Aspergillus pseudotamarii]
MSLILPIFWVTLIQRNGISLDGLKVNMPGALTETVNYVEPSESSRPCCKI